MTKLLLIPAVSLLMAQASPPAKPPAASPAEIAAAAPASDWVAIAAEDQLVMDLAPDAAGVPRRVVIQLMPAPFSRAWIGNIRTLATAGWWDGTSVNRVQDNYVAQWGDATEAKPLPAGLATPDERDYDVAWTNLSGATASASGGEAVAGGQVGAGGAARRGDAYADGVRVHRGWPIAFDAAPVAARRAWPVHCYAMVGVGRNLSPDTGTGAELYTVIGHAPRHLDRNIALVGRVISGIEHLSSLPRGTGPLGVYERAEQRVPIRTIRLASALPAGDRPQFQYLSSESASYQRFADARANRRDPFFNRPAGGADICNLVPPVRQSPAR